MLSGSIFLFVLTFLALHPFSQPETITGDGERGEDSPRGSPAPGGATKTVQSAETEGEGG